MAKIVFIERLGNPEPYDEGNAGRVLHEATFRVTDALHADLVAADKVTSKWTGDPILQDGTAPDYKDADGADRVLSELHESANLADKGTPDLTLAYAAAGYGYEDDFSTDLA